MDGRRTHGTPLWGLNRCQGDDPPLSRVGVGLLRGSPWVPSSQEGISWWELRGGAWTESQWLWGSPGPWWVLWVPRSGAGVLWPLTAVGLILSMLTVVLLITRPAHGDAASAVAGEVVQGASGALHAWGERSMRALLPPSARCPPRPCPPPSDLGSPARRCSPRSR